MRIAFIHHINYQYHGLSDLVFSLSKLGHEIVDITWSGSMNLGVRRVKKNLVQYLLPGLDLSFNTKIGNFPYVPSIDTIIEMVKPDIIHAQSHLFLTTCSAVKSAKKYKIPAIVTVHGVLAQRSLPINIAQKTYLYTIGSWCLNNATKVICLTKRDAYEVMKYFRIQKRISVIPNGVDIDTFKPSSEEDVNLIGWIGRFVPEKGLDYLLEAFRIVSKLEPDIRLVLIGDGPLRPRIVKLANKYGLNNKIIITCEIPHEKISDILSRVSLFILPSIKEGMPVTLLEIMASGKPVVGSKISGIMDVINNGQNGLLVPSKNPQAIADAILLLLNDKSLRRRLGRNARQLMVEKYSWNSITNKVEKVYNETIKES